MTLSFIFAMDKNRVIGKDNKMPWHLPAELQYFKKVTMGHPIVMGRKTHESIGRPLPGRENIVLTRDPEYKAEGCKIMHSVQEVLDFVNDQNEEQNDEVFVIGGAKLFEQFFEAADRLYITKIDHAFEGDTFFPEMNESLWKVVSKTKGRTDEKNLYAFDYLVYERV